MTHSAPGVRRRPVASERDVLPAWRGTPIASLLLAQNQGATFPVGPEPSLLVATCIDSRVRLALPPGAAFELRAAGVNLDERELFEIAFAVAVGGVRHVAVLGHEDCAMGRIDGGREAFARGLASTDGWDHDAAGAFFDAHAADWVIGDPAAATLATTRRLRSRFPGVIFAPLHYTVPAGRIEQILEPEA